MTAPSADAMFRSAFGHDLGGYAAAALMREAEAVAAAAAGERNARLNNAAFALGGLIASGHLCRADVEQRLLDAAMAAGLNRAEATATIRSGLRAGTLTPRGVPMPQVREDRPLRPLPRRQEDAAARNRQRAIEIWRATVPASGTVTELWLAERGIRFAIPAGIRHHQALTYWQDGREVGRWPAMVVGMRGPDGSFAGVHRTYLDDAADGGPVRKAPVEPARMMLGKAGFAWFGRRDANAIIAGEGVETVLAASELGRADLPPWGCCSVPDDQDPPPVPAVPADPYGFTPVACFSAGGLAVFDPPSTVRRLFICEDADEAGRTAASKLAASAHKRSITVNILRFSERPDGC